MTCRRFASPGWFVAVLVLGSATPAATQETSGGIGRLCAESASGAEASCRRAAFGVESARAALALGATGGADLAGTPSTLGKRVGAMPRLAFAVRVGVTRANVPSFSAAGGDDDRWIRSLRFSAAVNLLQGFTLGPTVGGVLSADAIGDVSLVSPSGDDAFGDGLTAGGVGIRVGLIRESFSLPGITVSAMRRWVGDAAFGRDGEEGADFGTTITSLRGIVGKDLVRIGLYGGVGWERTDGDAALRAFADTPSPPAVNVEANGLESDRVLFFGGASYSALVWRVVVEGGWGGGTGERGAIDDFDADAGSLFFALGVRLLL